MKRIFYIFLMMILTTFVSFFIYLSLLTIIARHHLVPLTSIDPFLGMMMSHEAYSIIVLISILWGYFMAKKWWQIIYVDGVYYFDKAKKRDARKRVYARKKI